MLSYLHICILLNFVLMGIKGVIMPIIQSDTCSEGRAMYIHWEKKFETGQPIIDAEHRLLVMLFRKLDVGIKTHVPDETILRIVLEVRRFVEFHFVSEENLMYETSYPGIDEHKTLHAELLMELNDMISKLNKRREFPDDILYFISNWLYNHIAHHDQQLAKHLENAIDRPVAEFIYPEYLQSIAKGVKSD